MKTKSYRDFKSRFFTFRKDLLLSNLLNFKVKTSNRESSTDWSSNDLCHSLLTFLLYINGKTRNLSTRWQWYLCYRVNNRSRTLGSNIRYRFQRKFKYMIVAYCVLLRTIETFIQKGVTRWLSVIHSRTHENFHNSFGLFLLFLSSMWRQYDL